MSMITIFGAGAVGDMARRCFERERSRRNLTGWFLTRELVAEYETSRKPGQSRETVKAGALCHVVERLPLTIGPDAIFAGSQSDAFSESYALINPEFRVETFSGYCDPLAIYHDIKPEGDISAERIERQRAYDEQTDYVKALKEVYETYDTYTSEVAFFIEQVTGHVIPDFRPALRHGVGSLLRELDEKIAAEPDPDRGQSFKAMRISLRAAILLAERYADIALEQQKTAEGKALERLRLMESTLRAVPNRGARTLHEALQSFLLLWQVMCLEQAPNPYAFSVGNADRVFEPYRAAEGMSREDAAELFKHFLVFFNVGSRSWAISQNILVGGRDLDGNDLTNESTYAIMDAYYAMNLPQPILSVKLHGNTPPALYEAMGKFFFTPGCLTPSLFNDDSLFAVLEAGGIEREDLPDYAVAGCQEPLIMGKDNGNTTNSWLNLGKILELCLTGGESLITGKRILPAVNSGASERLRNLRESFYENAAHIIDRMAEAANAASRAVSLLPVPFLSAFMGGLESGRDMRATSRQGTKYNASGCLIHGLSVVADSFVAADRLLRERPDAAEELLDALRNDFEGYGELRSFLRACPKFGNNENEADEEAVELVRRISGMVKAKKNYLGNPFRADWSTPSTHLLYGYWVGATPDGRGAREMLNYGVDPLFGDASSGLGFRTLSAMKLPFIEMNGGYASHFGIDPKYFRGETCEQRGLEFREKVIAPLFYNPLSETLGPYYLYVNVTTPETLRMVLANPKKYAPSGVYIMRIHGTFVNFLDLSPAIQQDIIRRLDPRSSGLAG